MHPPQDQQPENRTRKPELEASWLAVLGNEFEAPYFSLLRDFLIEERKKHIIYPPGQFIFNAFNSTPLPAVKAVILGQDPYHGEGQAHGLCFSVPHGVEPPPSLKNIFKELAADIGFRDPGHGNLEKWAKEGVLLLNATLTVRKDLAGSHQGKGWEQFTDAAIRAISEYRAGVVFLLWGKYAMAKQALIDSGKHYILTAPHPSPLSASRGFFGCRHFSKTNNFLEKIGYGPINWQI
ncbi:MAG TPA: uracil-DNA glycosylase [Bacteroidales bacterium]|nr:uracil-DNA glycosylase [Bacteroidales bacterium]